MPDDYTTMLAEQVLGTVTRLRVSFIMVDAIFMNVEDWRFIKGDTNNSTLWGIPVHPTHCVERGKPMVATWGES